MKDLKDALSNARKADTTHVRRAFQIYTSRPCEYGNDKYERGNYRRPTGGAAHTTPTREDFERYRAYLRAARDHIDENLDAMELHLATDPQLLDVEGMKRAAYAADTDVTPGAKVGASLLPHVAPACSSLNMAIVQATDCGLLPRDPGTPWRNVEHVAPVLLKPKALSIGAAVRVISDSDGLRKPDECGFVLGHVGLLLGYWRVGFADADSNGDHHALFSEEELEVL